MSSRQLLSYLTGISRWSLMTLPPELQSMILHCLPFKDLVTMATVSRHFRMLALGERRLWKELPQASLDNVEKLLPFLDRAGQLGTALRIDGIQQDRIDYLVEILYFAVPSLRSLRLHFECRRYVDSGAMGRVMYAIAKSAPLLEHLELAASNYLDPLSVLPRLPTFYTPPPRLASLKLTAYTLEGPPPAFCNVTDVVTTLAVLCPFPQPSLHAEPQWTNATLHEKFPEVRRLKLAGIDSGPDGLAGDSEAYALRRLPYVDEPLSELELHFRRARERADIEDPEAVRWITEGTQNVHRLVLQHLDCFAVRDAALMELSGAQGLYLHIWNLGDGLFEISAECQTTGRDRTVCFLKRDLDAHLARILATPLICVTELGLHRGSWTPEVLRMFAGYCHLETLRFVRNAGPLFPDVPDDLAPLGSVKSFRYFFHTPVQIDAIELAAFIRAVVPRITSLALSHSVTLINPHALPPTICLGEM